ncbi:hypothetical protein V501_06650 [Pseudogymnoascus sp. VKM F-4519 (FW-2642)]|nr:hypothetical protein V501_06650 [Pseudogymnoascus sp. VKM F-4519 (FW-2642)]
MSWDLLKRFIESDVFNQNPFLSVAYLSRYADHVGITYVLCSKLRQFSYEEIEFFLPQLCHLIISLDNESMALEEFILDLCEESVNGALLASQPPDPFKTCRRIYNKVQRIVFGVTDTARVEKIKENTLPVTVLASFVLASIGMPGLPRWAGPLAISQARKPQESEATVSDSSQTQKLARSHTVAGSGSRQRRTRDSLRAASATDTRVGGDSDTKPPRGASLEARPPSSQSTRKSALDRSMKRPSQFTLQPPDAQSSTISLPLPEPSSPKSVARPLTPLSARFGPRPDIPHRRHTHQVRPLSPSILNTRQKGKLLRQNYFRSEIQFLTALENISTRLIMVPKAARLSALRAELVMIAQDLPAEVDIPVICPATLVDGVPSKSKHHRIVRLNPTECTVLNSAEKVPYLLMVEVLRDDFTFDPEASENDALLKKLLAEQGTSRRRIFDLQDAPRLPTVEAQQPRSVPDSVFEPVQGDLGTSPAIQGEDEGHIPAVPDLIRSTSTVSSPSTATQSTVQSITSSHPTPRTSGTSNSGSNSPGQPRKSTLPLHSRPSGSDQPNYPALATHIRTAAQMLTQLESTSGKRPRSEVDAIRAKIIASMQSLEEQSFGNHDTPTFDTIMANANAAPVNNDDEDVEGLALELVTTGAGAARMENDEKTGGVQRKGDRDDPSAAMFGEAWSEKKERIRKSSPYGWMSNWDLISVIVKTGDDLRQEAFACQLIQVCDKIWQDAGTPVWVKRMRILVTGESSGLIETITNGVSLHSIKRSLTLATIEAGNNPRGRIATLRDHFIKAFGDPEGEQYKAAATEFKRSLAAYSIISYVLQLKDRHNGNVLIDNEGHIVHIDFGFMLSNSPGSVGFEAAPFKLTQDYVDVLGGVNSAEFQDYKVLCKQAFQALRRSADNIIDLVSLMGHGSKMPCFQYGVLQATNMLRQRFQLQLSADEAEKFVETDLIAKSLGSYYTRLYDTYQYRTQAEALTNAYKGQDQPQRPPNQTNQTKTSNTITISHSEGKVHSCRASLEPRDHLPGEDSGSKIPSVDQRGQLRIATTLSEDICSDTMSSKDNTTPTLPSHRRAKSHDVRSTVAVEGPRPSLPGSVPFHPRVFGLGLGFESASELVGPAAAQAAPVSSAGDQPILGTDTEGTAGEGAVSASPAGWSQVSNHPPTMATGAPLPPIQKGVTSSDLADLEAAAAAAAPPQPPVPKVATQGPGGSSSAAVRSHDAVASSPSAFFGRGPTRTAVREDQDRVPPPTRPHPQLLPGFVSPRRRRDARIQTGSQAGPSSNAGRRPVTPVNQVIPTYDQRREAEDAWLRREELHRRERERQQQQQLQRELSEFNGSAWHYPVGAAVHRQPFVVAGPRAPIAPAAAAAAAGPAFLGRPRGNSQASAIEQASAFGDVVPGPSHRARFVSVPAGGYGAADDRQAHIRSPRTAAVDSYVDSPGHGPCLGDSRLEGQGAYTEHLSPSTPEGMTREMYEMMCAFSEDVRQEQEDVDEEVDDGEDAAAAAAEAASFRMPMPGINQHGHLELPRGLTRAEFEAEQSQLMADALAFSELVGAEEQEEEEVAAAAAQEAEDRRRDAMGHRHPRASSPGAASASSYYGTGTLDAETWQAAEDELWDVLNRRRVPSYDEKGALVFPTSPSAAEIARERAAIFKRARRRAEEAVGGASQGAGWGGGEGPLDRNPQIPFGIPEDMYDQACAFNEQVRQEEADRERAEGQAGPSHTSPLPAPLACPPGLIEWGVTEEGLISAWRNHVAQQPAGSGVEQHGARPPLPVHHRDPFDERDVAAISRSTAAAAARSGFLLGRSSARRSSARNATRGSYHPAEISTGSPRPRGRGVVIGEYVAPPEQGTPLPARRRAMRTPSPSVYSRTSGFGTVQAADQRPVIGGVSSSDRGDVFRSPAVMLAPVFAGIQRRNLASFNEQVNSGSDPVDEDTSREGQEEGGVKGKMVIRNGSAARASSSSLSDGGAHASRWVYESPSIGKMDSGPPRDKGKRAATASEVAAQVAEEEMLLLGTSASPAASEMERDEGEGEGVIRPPSPAVSQSETLLDDSGSRDELLPPPPSPPPPPPSSATAPTLVPLLAGAHRTLDLDEDFEYDAGIEAAPKSTRRAKVTGGLRGLARGIKDALKSSSSRKAAARPPPQQAAAVATPRPEIVDGEANQSTATGLSVGGRPGVFASLTGRFTPRPGSSASAHRAPRVQVSGTGSLGSRRWPARRSSLARAFSIPNLRSPSLTAGTLNKPLPQTPLFVVRETASGDEASSTPDIGESVESVGLLRPATAAVEGQSLRRGRYVSFADQHPSTTTRWLRSSGSAPEIVPRGEEQDEEPTPVRAQQQRIDELSAALEQAESSRLAAEARASAAEAELTRAHAELDVYVAEATVAQRALTAARVEFQLQLDLARRETERHAAETELGGLQTQLLYAGVGVGPQQQGGARGARQSLQFPAAAPAAQQEEGTAANEPPQQPPSPEFVYLGPRHRFGSRLPEPGLFQILPHPIPLPPQQPPFAPSESVRLANRAGRLAAEAGGPEYRQRMRRRQVPDSD